VGRVLASDLSTISAGRTGSRVVEAPAAVPESCEDTARRGEQRAWAGDLVVHDIFGQGRLDMLADGHIKMDVGSGDVREMKTIAAGHVYAVKFRYVNAPRPPTGHSATDMLPMASLLGLLPAEEATSPRLHTRGGRGGAWGVRGKAFGGRATGRGRGRSSAAALSGAPGTSCDVGPSSTRSHSARSTPPPTRSWTMRARRARRRSRARSARGLWARRLGWATFTVATRSIWAIYMCQMSVHVHSKCTFCLIGAPRVLQHSHRCAASCASLVSQVETLSPRSLLYFCDLSGYSWLPPRATLFSLGGCVGVRPCRHSLGFSVGIGDHLI
jgi:hypothetical protein